MQKLNLIRHEYGHFLQLQNKGYLAYTFEVAIPSFTGSILQRQNKLIYPYLSLPWEYEASLLGGDTRINKISKVYNLSFWDLLRMF